LARETGCDQSEEHFDTTLQTVGRHRPAKSQDQAKAVPSKDRPEKRGGGA